MENNEEVLNALEEFSRLTNGSVSTVLDQYLCGVAANGITLFPWYKLKPLLRHKLDMVMKDFQMRSPVDIQIPCPNVENVNFDEMHQRLLAALDQFAGTPFTIQRLCELVTNPTKHYKKTDKFMRGVEKNLNVVTTVDCFGNRIVNESKLMVNGLDSSDVERSATPDMFSGVVTTSSASGDNFDSPYTPAVPMNSPSNTPVTAGSNTWFSGMSRVANSPSSYPNWQQQDHRSSAADCGVWSSPPFEADDHDGPSPTKRIFLQDEDGNKKNNDDLVPMVTVAPLLGQLLNSNEEASGGLTNGHAVAAGTKECNSFDSPDNGVDTEPTDVESILSATDSVSASVEPTAASTENNSVCASKESIDPQSITDEHQTDSSYCESADPLTDTPPQSSHAPAASIDLSLDMSFGNTEESEASCLIQSKLIESNVTNSEFSKEASLSASSGDCDSTGGVSVLNSATVDNEPNISVSANDDEVTPVSEDAHMDTD